MTDAFSRLLLEDPTEPGPEPTKAITFEPLPAERPVEHPIEPAVDPVPEAGLPQAAPLVRDWANTAITLGDDLEWGEVEPFLRGWALMIQDVRVENTTHASELAMASLTSTLGPGRVILTLDRATGYAEIVFDRATLATTPPEMLMQGRFMQSMADATQRLNTYLRAHLVTGVRGPG